MHVSRLFSVIAAVFCVSVSSSVFAAGNEFTYQGRLLLSGAPVDDLCDFRFRLYDAASNGAQVGAQLTAANVNVADGVVTVDLDFGPGIFTGAGRWLEIDVRCPAGAGAYTTLSPRQPITAAPYALKSLGNTMSWMDAAGAVNTFDSVGIGTDAPLAALHVRGEQSTLRLEDNDDPNSFTEVKDAQPTQVRINKTNSNGLVLFDVNPMPTDGVSAASIRFFRETDTSGPKSVHFLRGNFTTQTSASIGVDGADSFFQLHGGNVGVGTSTPAARLTVETDTTNSGDNTARFYAPSIGPNVSHVHYGSNGNWYIRSASSAGRVILQDLGGVVGIGSSGSTAAKVTIGASTEDYALNAASQHATRPTIQATNVGGGASLWADGTSDASLGGGGLIVAGSLGANNIAVDANEIMARNNGTASTLLINREGGDVAIGSASGGTSRLITPVIQITGGSDFSEMFDVGGDLVIEPGMVVVIDPDNPGRLIPSMHAYDCKVAGVVSGAGGVGTGMVMGHDGTIADGEHPVALSGRVYCLVDATHDAIQPGDMLTTSDTPGHAMKALDRDRAGGAVIGKAMTSLPRGEVGLVLVLVNLQ